MSYGGKKIDNARKKYLPENFKYEILEEYEYSTNEELKEKLDEREIYYIDYYDTFKNGYNSTLGGGGNLGYVMSEDTKQKLSISCSGWHHTEEVKKKISNSKLGHKVPQKSKEAFEKYNNSRKKKIDVFDAQTKTFIKSFDSILQASKELNIDRRNIYAVLNNKIKCYKGYYFKLQ